MMNFNAEMIEKAKAAKSAEELLEIAKDNGEEMTADEAKSYFAQLNPKSGELDDDDLDNVAGGACAKTEQARDASEAVGEMDCPLCARYTGWRINRKQKDKTSFYCCNCKRICYLLAEENNSILHVTDSYWSVALP